MEARSLEIFLQSLVETTAHYTNERRAKTMTTSHLLVGNSFSQEFNFFELKHIHRHLPDFCGVS